MRNVETPWVWDLIRTPVPGVARDAHEEIGRMVHQSDLMKECAAGNPRAVAAMYWGYMPYVDQFKGAIYQYVRRRSVRQALLKTFGQASPVVAHEFASAMKQVAQEEGEHRDLWIESALSTKLSTGLTQEKLFANPVPEVVELIPKALDANPFRAMLGLVATESIATQLSAMLLSSDRFLGLHHNGPLKIRWYLEHVLPHEGPSHKDLQEYLASGPFRESAGENFVPAFWNGMMDFAKAFSAAADKVLETYQPAA